MGGSIPPARVRLPRRQAGSASRILPCVSDAVETARDRLFRIVSGEFRVRRGHPLPYGAAARRDGVNFSVFSKHATAVSLVLFAPGEEESVLELPLDPRYNKTGDVWHVFVEGIDPGIEYGFRADCEPNPAPAAAALRPRQGPARPLLEVGGGPRDLGRGGGREGPARAAALPRGGRGVRLGPRAPPRRPPRRLRHLRGARPRLHPPPELRRVAPRHLPRGRGEDPLPEGAGGDRGRAHAGHGVRGVRQPAHEPPHRRAAPQLLGLPARVLLRAEGLLRRERRSGRGGARVQVDGEGAARGGHRGDPRHRLQPHRRGRREGRHLLLARARQPDLLPPRPEDAGGTSTTRAAGTPSTATTRSCASRSWPRCATGSPRCTWTASASTWPRSSGAAATARCCRTRRCSRRSPRTR